MFPLLTLQTEKDEMLLDYPVAKIWAMIPVEAITLLRVKLLAEN